MTPDHGPVRGSANLPYLLLRHRLAAGLTQAELAARAGVGVRTVRDLERGRSVRPQRTTVELLAGALGLIGRDRGAFLAAARGRRVPGVAVSDITVGGGSSALVAALGDGTPWRTERPAVPGGSPVFGLDPPVDLLGRDREVAEIATLLAMVDAGRPPLLSLVGLAGVGKSALARSVAYTLAAWHRAGVSVSEGSDPADVLSVVAAAFGVARPAELAERLGDRPALLVVDAAERAPGAVAAALDRLTGSVPGLRVLVTGRHPVGLPGERVWPVTPLDVPPEDPTDTLSEAITYPAAALFLTRLSQVRRDPPRSGEPAALGRLVRLLGGLPLAIELVAAQGRDTDLNDLLNRYADGALDVAVAPAPRTAVPVPLRAAVDASYRQLTPAERRALRRFAVFRNRWSVEFAEELLTADTDRPVDPVPVLDRLVELGLLGVFGTGAFRFRLPDVVRDFAAERAVASGETTEIRRRHAVVFDRWAGRVMPDPTGRGPGTAAVRQLDEVAGDLSAALAHAAIDDPHTALRLAASLSGWWRFRGRDVLGRQWLRRLLDDPRTADADPVLRVRAEAGVARATKPSA